MFATTIDTETGSSTTASADALVADSSRASCESFAWCLNAYGGLRNVGTACTSGELLSAIRSQRPRVVLIGERLLTAAMRDLFSELAVKLGETRIVCFADGLTDRQLDLVVNNKVSGLVSRQDCMRTVSDHLIQVSAGQNVLSEKLRDRVTLAADGKFKCVSTAQLRKLTDRQWDVLLRIAEGNRVAEVAEALQITQKAVEAHKYRIMRVIGATDRVDLCRWAIREGLIDP
ncbi:MAG: response regulator transcription factor [Planctomycetaceae bacterium]|nr:response regulator transcription factor [Planctomycetaceae bacterium]